MGLIKSMFTSLFNPNVEQASSAQTSLTGRDLVSSTSSETPTSPVMGDSKKKNRNGVSSLLVPSENMYRGGK